MSEPSSLRLRFAGSLRLQEAHEGALDGRHRGVVRGFHEPAREVEYVRLEGERLRVEIARGVEDPGAGTWSFRSTDWRVMLPGLSQRVRPAIAAFWVLWTCPFTTRSHPATA